VVSSFYMIRLESRKKKKNRTKDNSSFSIEYRIFIEWLKD